MEITADDLNPIFEQLGIDLELPEVFPILDQTFTAGFTGPSTLTESHDNRRDHRRDRRGLLSRDRLHPGAQAQVAERLYKERPLVVRRTRLTDRHQAKLWLDWRHFGFVTDLDGDTVAVDAFHPRDAMVELDIRDLTQDAGMETGVGDGEPAVGHRHYTITAQDLRVARDRLNPVVQAAARYASASCSSWRVRAAVMTR